MCILGIQLDFVHVWDRQCQALFVFPALSSRVSAAPNPASLGLVVGRSWEQGMEDGGGAGDTARSRGWNGMELGQTLESFPVPEGAALEGL